MAAVGLAAALALGACTHVAGALPEDGATPRQVLDAYLLALQAGDCATTHAYAVDAFLTDGELCGHVNVALLPERRLHAKPSPTRSCSPPQLTIKDGDQSLPDGDHLWFSTLRRQPTVRGGSARVGPDPEPPISLSGARARCHGTPDKLSLPSRSMSVPSREQVSP